MIDNYMLVASQILNGIDKGVLTENGEVRAFDIFDYYAITDIGIFSFVKIMEKLNFDVAKKIRFFANEQIGRKITYKAYNFHDPETLLEYVLTIDFVRDVDFDENYHIIPGSGKTVTEEEKRNIVEFMTELNCPLNEIFFNRAVDRLENNIPLNTSGRTR